MKKLTAILLCMLLLGSVMSIAFTSSALDVSINSGLSALKAQWIKDKSNGIEFMYYSPVRNSSDNTKYPVVIILHGKFSGDYNGHQLDGSDFAKWSSKEYQARFKDAGGAFIIMPVSPGGAVSGWGTNYYDDQLFGLIDGFSAKYSKNVDTSRISIGGWCVGGEGAIRIAAKQPDRFSAVLAMVPYNGISKSEAKALADTPIWMVLSKNDTLAIYGTMGKPGWNNVKDNTKVPDKCRATVFEKYGYYDAFNHAVQYGVANDLLNQPSDSGMRTTTASGASVTLNENNAVISWLSQQRLDDSADDSNKDDSCKCDCHSGNGFTKFIFKIKVFFWKIFSQSKRVCACGANHW